VKKFGETIHLYPMEFKLLEFLMRHPDQLFSPETILKRLWHDKPDALVNTVRTHVKTLRQKIDCSGSESFISTVRGRGYRFRVR
jgi:two-component system OmpR family response regulator